MDCMDIKRCPRCGQTHALDAFYFLPSTGRVSAYCKSCSKQISYEWTKANREKARLSVLGVRDRALGLSEDWRPDVLEAQGGGCAICGRTVIGKRSMHLDHDHVTGVPRGILCNGCNTGIGHLQDDPDLLRKAAAYIEDHRDNPRDWSAYKPEDRRFRSRVDCPNGHPYSEDNTRLDGKGRRTCLTCYNAKLGRNRERRHKRYSPGVRS